MMLIYNILFAIAFMVYLPVLILKGKLHSGFGQRLGFFTVNSRYQLAMKPNLWFHAVSVGEVLAILNLVERMRRHYPHHRMVITVVTQTGYDLALKRFAKEDLVFFAPLDFAGSVKKYLQRIQPVAFISAETELWPNLLHRLTSQEVPTAIVNGRVSDKSFYRYLRFRFFFKDILKPIRLFCMQSNRDADRMIALGAQPQRVVVAGSMKFDEATRAEPLDRSRLGLNPEDQVWIAGSTHPGEEKLILEIYLKLKAQFTNLVLVLAPRHIERTEEVLTLIQSMGLSAIRYSEIPVKVKPATAVIVLDQIGPLKSLYGLATVVFIGKSLLGFGGQNIIEPAFYAKPIITGPHMENFRAIMDSFLEARGVVEVEDSAQLLAAVQRLLSDEKYRKALGERAQAVVHKHQGATQLTEHVLQKMLSTRQFIHPA